VNPINVILKLLGVGKYSKWERGSLKSLMARPDYTVAYSEGFQEKPIEVKEALLAFVGAMGIEEEQMYKISPDDKIFEVYQMVRISNNTDSLEFEGLLIAIEKKKGIKLHAWFTPEKTVKDWINLWIH
jgi:hypothetical protein